MRTNNQTLAKKKVTLTVQLICSTRKAMSKIKTDLFTRLFDETGEPREHESLVQLSGEINRLRDVWFKKVWSLPDHFNPSNYREVDDAFNVAKHAYEEKLRKDWPFHSILAKLSWKFGIQDFEIKGDNLMLMVAVELDLLPLVTSILEDQQLDADVSANNYASVILAIRNASRNGNVNILRLLLNHKQSIYQACIEPAHELEGELALSVACKLGNVEIIKMLLSDSASRFNPAAQHNIALCNAVAEGYVDAVQVLLQDKRVSPVSAKSVNFKFRGMQSSAVNVLEIACVNGGIEMVKVLLQDKRALPCLPFAVRHGYNDMVHLMLQYGLTWDWICNTGSFLFTSSSSSSSSFSSPFSPSPPSSSCAHKYTPRKQRLTDEVRRTYRKHTNMLGAQDVGNTTLTKFKNIGNISELTKTVADVHRKSARALVQCVWRKAGPRDAATMHDVLRYAIEEIACFFK